MEFVAQSDNVKLFIDSLKLSAKLNAINSVTMRDMPAATTFPDEYKRHLAGLLDKQLSGTGQADFADNENNEMLYERLSTEGHLVSVGYGGAIAGSPAEVFKTSLEKFDPIKGGPGAISMFDFSLKKYASAPVIRGFVLNDASLIDIAVPTAPVAALASPAAPGNVDNGTHSYKYTFVNAQGESAPSASSNVITITDKTVNGQVVVTIAIGPASTTQRKLYRRVAGDTGTWKLLATVANNTAISYTDNIADVSLGADAPATSTADFFGTIVQFGTAPGGTQMYASLHVIAGTGGTLTVTLQSDDNAGMTTPATVFAFTGATGLTQELKNGSTNLQSYYRIKAEITGGVGWMFFVAAGYAV